MYYNNQSNFGTLYHIERVRELNRNAIPRPQYLMGAQFNADISNRLNDLREYAISAHDYSLVEVLNKIQNTAQSMVGISIPSILYLTPQIQGYSLQQQPLQVHHYYDWSDQAAVLPVKEYSKMHRQAIVTEMYQNSLSLEIAQENESYSQQHVQQPQRQQAAQAAAQPANEEGPTAAQVRAALEGGGMDVHNYARLYGVSHNQAPELEARICEKLNHINLLQRLNAISTVAAWDAWRRDVLRPWLAQIPVITGRNELRPLQETVFNYLNVGPKKIAVDSALRDFGARIAANDLAELTRLGSYEFKMLLGIRLISSIIEYTKSPFFERWPQEDRNMLYSHFVEMLSIGLAHCIPGALERCIMLAKHQVLKNHAIYIEQAVAESDLLEEMLTPFLVRNTAAADQIQPTTLLTALAMRIFKATQRLEDQPEYSYWAAIHAQMLETAQDYPVVRDYQTQCHRIKDWLLEMLLPSMSHPRQQEEVIKIKPVYILNQDNLEYWNSLSPELRLGIENEIANPQLAAIVGQGATTADALFLQQAATVVNRLRQQGLLQGLDAALTENLPAFMFKKIAEYTIKNALAGRLAVMHPPVLRQNAQNLVSDFQRITACRFENIEELKQFGPAFVTRLNNVVRGGNRQQCARAMILGNFLNTQINRSDSFESLRAAFENSQQNVTELLQLCQTLSAPVPDLSWEPLLNEYLQGEIFAVASVIGRASQAIHAQNRDYFTREMLSFYPQASLPDQDRYPFLEDFLDQAQRISGLSRSHWEVILGILGRSTVAPNLLEAEHEPGTGSLLRGLVVLANNIRFNQRKKVNHRYFMTDEQVLRDLLNWHINFSINLRSAQAQVAVRFHPYIILFGSAAAYTPLEGGFGRLVERVQLRSAIELPTLLSTGRIDAVLEVLKVFSQRRGHVQYADVVINQVLKWMHLNNDYRLFKPLLQFAQAAGPMYLRIIQKDFADKLCYYKAARQLLPFLHGLATDNKLCNESALLLAAIDLSDAYLKQVIDNSEHFTQYFEQLQQNTVQETQLEQLQKILLTELSLRGFDLTRAPWLLAAYPQRQLKDLLNMAIREELQSASAISAKKLFDAGLSRRWTDMADRDLIDNQILILILNTISARSGSASDIARNEYFEHVLEWISQNRPLAHGLELRIADNSFMRNHIYISHIRLLAQVQTRLGLKILHPHHNAYRLLADNITQLNANNSLLEAIFDISVAPYWRQMPPQTINSELDEIVSAIQRKPSPADYLPLLKKVIAQAMINESTRYSSSVVDLCQALRLRVSAAQRVDLHYILFLQQSRTPREIIENAFTPYVTVLGLNNPADALLLNRYFMRLIAPRWNAPNRQRIFVDICDMILSIPGENLSEPLLRVADYIRDNHLLPAIPQANLHNILAANTPATHMTTAQIRLLLAFFQRVGVSHPELFLEKTIIINSFTRLIVDQASTGQQLNDFFDQTFLLRWNVVPDEQAVMELKCLLGNMLMQAQNENIYRKQNHLLEHMRPWLHNYQTQLSFNGVEFVGIAGGFQGQFGRAQLKRLFEMLELLEWRLITAMPAVDVPVAIEAIYSDPTKAVSRFNMMALSWPQHIPEARVHQLYQQVLIQYLHSDNTAQDRIIFEALINFLRQRYPRYSQRMTFYFEFPDIINSDRISRHMQSKVLDILQHLQPLNAKISSRTIADLYLRNTFWHDYPNAQTVIGSFEMFVVPTLDLGDYALRRETKQRLHHFITTAVTLPARQKVYDVLQHICQHHRASNWCHQSLFHGDFLFFDFIRPRITSNDLAHFEEVEALTRNVGLRKQITLNAPNIQPSMLAEAWQREISIFRVPFTTRVAASVIYLFNKIKQALQYIFAVILTFFGFARNAPVPVGQQRVPVMPVAARPVVPAPVAQGYQAQPQANPSVLLFTSRRLMAGLSRLARGVGF